MTEVCSENSDTPKCELCGEPMPDGETMFKFHGYSGPCPKPPLPKDTQPRVIDFDDGEISVRLDGKELRGWSYKDDAERRVKIGHAREYVEGWCDASALLLQHSPGGEK